jgi:formylglycine-generating enzyme required for sulfatase activity
VAAGSVVLRFARDGAEPVLLAAVLPRGGAERLDVTLPERGSIPQGFVYIPAGRFLYGSSGGEEPRAFYESQPSHPVETGAFLIARDETTFGDWLAFLRALPAGGRAQRTPKVSRQGFTVVLGESGDGTYRLTLGPDDHPYTAPEGVALRYPGRTTRSSVDWSRLPVTGVSYLDALAYMAWLRDTGRVPGARPCTEHEWERAARGADGRAFPHGESLAPDDANHDVTYGRRPDAFGPDEVGSHPASDDAYGVHDLTGNVWEWTAWVDDPVIPVSRGGSFFQTAAVARPENRARDVPDRPDAYYGVRVCADRVTAFRTPGLR